MELAFAKQIGRHLASEAGGEDPDRHLPWAFAHALGNLPGPASKHSIWLKEGEVGARWLVDDGTIPALFSVAGHVTTNEANDRRPFASVTASSVPLRADRWTITLDSTYGEVRHGQGYRHRWTFRYLEEDSIALETERTWDGEEEWFDEREVFARLLAGGLGWELADLRQPQLAA